MGLGAATILHCGWAECRPSWWNHQRIKPEPFAKIFAVVAGEALYGDEEREVRLVAGRLYFFPPRLRWRHSCRRFDVHWMHFAIDSPWLESRFARLREVDSWPLSDWSAWEGTWSRLQEFSDQRGPDLELRLQSFILAVLASASERHPASDPAAAERERFAPALRLMDEQFRRNPPLAQIAASAGLSPAHFHRSFRGAFGLTPHAYLLRKRMEAARDLLTRTAMPVSEVAEACGYEDPFYFSRVFKRWAHASPEKYRAARTAP